MKPEAFQATTSSPEETEALGERLGELLTGGELLCLTGALGSGKTVLVRGLARALGCPPGEVASPTYVLERISAGRDLILRHIDAYRLSGPAEFEESDLVSELLDPGTVSALEWADRVAEALPPERLEIELRSLGPQKRRISLRACGGSYDSILEQLASGSTPDS